MDKIVLHLCPSVIKIKKRNNMENQNEKKMTITRTLDAPRALVWDVWTEQKHVREWFSPKGFTNPVCDWKPEAGNNIYVEMKGPDGKIYPMGGEFLEIDKPEKLVFIASALDGSGKPFFKQHTTVLFTEEGNKTKLTVLLHFTNIVPEGLPHLAGANEGWNMTLDKLEELLKTLS
jgi:uncharacterized protein YndB with AHSA1/START domain